MVVQPKRIPVRIDRVVMEQFVLAKPTTISQVHSCSRQNLPEGSPLERHS